MPMIICVRCETPAEKRYATSRFCSSTCSQASWYEANRDLTLERAATWKSENPESVRKSSRETYRRNAAEYREVGRRYRQTDAGRAAHNAAEARRRERRAGSQPGDGLSKAYMEILMRDPCSYCGAPTTSVDHIVPLASQGPGSWDNLTSACRRCNTSKHARPLLGWLLSP